MPTPLFAPMLAASGRPAGDLSEWSAETNLDGWRVQVTVDKALTVRTRSGRVITTQVPELRALADLGCPAVLEWSTPSMAPTSMTSSEPAKRKASKGSC